MRIPLALLLLVGLLLAGCAASDADDAVLAPAGQSRAPEIRKVDFASTMPTEAPLLPVMETEPPAPVESFDIQPGTARLQLAFDLEGGGEPLQVWLVDVGGDTLFEAEYTVAGKQVAVVDAPPMGRANLYAMSEASWSVGLVVTTLWDDDGLRVQVSTPQQTDIEHAFYPAQLTAPAGQAARITLYDFDPHAGTGNLQHNLRFPDLGLKTEGKTTWGEARVLDMPGLAAGSYGFECEFHGFTGTLTVA